MQHEGPKQNNVISQKLEALDHLPEGFRFRQAAVWEKLEAGLQPAPKQRNVRWWYAAAIVISFSTSICFLYIKKDQPKPVAIAVKKDHRQALPASSPHLIPAVPVTASATVTTVHARVTTPTPKRRAQSIPSSAAQVATLNAITPEEKRIEEGAIPSPVLTEPTNMGAEPVAQATSGNRFRVAHINELRHPVIPAEVLHDKNKSAYTFLGKPLAVSAEKEEEPPLPIKKPKTLFGIFSTSQ